VWRLRAFVIALALQACAVGPVPERLSDAPEARPERRVDAATHPATYAQALQAWRSPEQVNAWIGDRFDYDLQRAVRLSESQRQASGSLPIHDPQAFYDAPRGICVDLARFGVETLQRIAPGVRAQYLMIEFDPVQIRGQMLRRHWVATFERDGQHWFFADSKRPGHIAGPYPSTQAYIADYAAYRGRAIVAWRELPSYLRSVKVRAQRSDRASP
jgi:hypothetical protein